MSSIVCILGDGIIFSLDENHRVHFVELDKKRVKHLASTIQDLLLTAMRHDDGK
jgi:hypothetical protein